MRASQSSARVGETILLSMSVLVKNHAVTSGASNVTLTSLLPEGLELVSTRANRGPGCTGSRTVVCRLDFLSSTLVATVEMVVRVAREGELVASTSVRADESDPDATNNTVATRIAPPPAVAPAAAPPAAPTSTPAVPMTGSSGANTLSGSSGADLIRGLGGNDALFGRSGNDRLLGGAGDDRLNGGPGRDFLDGGPGNDQIDARDGARDTVRCGAGRDTVLADRTDTVARDCEIVRRR